MCERAIPATDPARIRAHACPGATTQVQSAAADDAPDELEFHWGSAYHLAVIDGLYTARRRDGKGGTLTSAVPEGLRLLILADYAAMPVPRDLP